MCCNFKTFSIVNSSYAHKIDTFTIDIFLDKLVTSKMNSCSEEGLKFDRNNNCPIALLDCLI